MTFIRAVFLAVALLISGSVTAHAAVKHVILLSIDGLSAGAVSKFHRNHLTYFRQMVAEGAYTFNARPDMSYSLTLPNHMSMLTGRPVVGHMGHGVMINEHVDQTVHQLKGTHVDSVFDVVHAHGLTSAMAASKTKFDIFPGSFPIDRVFISDKKDNLTLDFALARLLSGAEVPAFLLIHLSGPDTIGHQYGWSLKKNSKYIQKVFEMDHQLGQIMQLVGMLNSQGESAVLIVTSDYGGAGKNHADKDDRRNYRIPFLVWGDGVARGKDLYDLNPETRSNPRQSRKSYNSEKQPVRNADAANLALGLLGLECVPGSSIGCDPVLKVK